MNSIVQCKMDIIFTNSGNSKTSDLHRLLLNLSEKNKLKKGAIKILLYQTLASTIYKKKCKFKISAPTSNEKIELPDESYSLSDIQDCFKYVIKNHETVTDNPPIKIYI